MPLHQSDRQLLDDLRALRRLEGVIDRIDRLQEGPARAPLSLAARLSRAFGAQRGDPSAADPP